MLNTSACACAGWQTHRQSLAISPQEADFHYCPWCGQRLTASKQQEETLLEKYRQRIEDSFFSTDEWEMPLLPNMLVAAHPIADYRQLTGDISGTLSLMLAFVEMGTSYSREYGDINESFYEGLELALGNFRDLLLANPHLYAEEDLSLRLPKLAHDAGWIGWGYGDYVTAQVSEIMRQMGDA